MEKVDFLVIGGGMAGLTFALKTADYGSVAVLFKKDPEESSTARAQGGIAAVSSGDDNFELHIQDTLTAGDGICREDTVRTVVTEGPERIKDLIRYGANFDRDKSGDLNGEYELHREGGHSKRRIYHSKDQTGLEIQQALLKAAGKHSNIKLMTYCFAIDIITTHKLGIKKGQPNTALGAYVLGDDGEVFPVLAKFTLVAAGGAGKVYLYTSNPDVATGDGIAMCFRAGVPAANMEFFQFHPTCLYHPRAKSFLITEAMRGEGAKLRTPGGKEFMGKYHELAELAPRDIVARAIDHEMKSRGDEYVLLDISHKGADFVRSHFPTIHAKCLEFGFDITTEPIPVVPAAHYCCGGAVAGEYGQTCIRNLFVAGESAYTGLHGANRLASNSLIEAAVYGHRAAENALSSLSDTDFPDDVPDWDPGSARDSDEQVVVTQTWEEIRRLMWNYVGIVRTDKRLERALRRSALIEREINQYYWDFKVTSDLLELRNLSLVANLVIRSAMMRKESRGLHYNLNYPFKDRRFEHETTITPSAYFHYTSPEL